MQTLQLVELGFSLNALDNGVKTKLRGEFDNGSNDGLALRTSIEAAYKRLIDLDCIDRKKMQTGKEGRSFQN